ncbi:MAG TPA: prepilin-type N-terminal cleavage/methylation domain-containing protein [Candidatus Acidoferrum sp.]|nr:prepilin-type N-terminal cleavage/methylation domain-containing protein [Candidatus Acidoferrum sp.]
MCQISPIEAGGGPGLIPVEWHDCTWAPPVQYLDARKRLVAPIKSLPATMLMRHHPRRKTMNPSQPFASRVASTRSGARGLKIPKAQTKSNRTMPSFTLSPMKNKSIRSRRFRAGFTLVELLVVIAIIAILAALLLPVLSHVKLVALKTQTRIQVNDIATAIQAYDSAYGRFPVSPAAQAAASAVNGDFTYGGMFQNNLANPAVAVGSLVNGVPTNNSDVIAILMDYTNFPDPLIGGFTVNTNYQKNPQKTGFLNAKMSGWDPLSSGTPAPGVGNDLVYRDIWGNPFLISMDLNYDGQCEDAFYRNHIVSGKNPGSTPQGYNGLVNPVDSTGNTDNYRFHGTVMVWSMGPYGPATPSASSFDQGPATDAANKNHILSWQ